MTLTYERLYPWLFAALALAISRYFEWSLPADANLPSLLSAAISVSAILVGFLATMKSILMAVPGVVAELREGDYIDDLAEYFTAGTAGNLLFCVLNISGFFSFATTHHDAFSSAWFGVGIFAILSFWRVTRIMTQLLRRS